MIPKGFVDKESFNKLTKSEAVAFVIFELKELARHRKDITCIQEDIQAICNVHDINVEKLKRFIYY